MTGNVWIDLQLTLADIEAEVPDMSGELRRIPTVGNAMGQRGLKGAIDDALNLNRMPKMTWTATITSAFVRRQGGSKITSKSYLTVDQGTACAALTPRKRRTTIMQNPEFTMAPGTNNCMQDFAWDQSKTRSS